MTSPDFLFTSLCVLLIPGTAVIYTVSTELFAGWRCGNAALRLRRWVEGSSRLQHALQWYAATFCALPGLKLALAER